MRGGVKLEIWEAAYTAGIIDGEGSITLTRMHEKNTVVLVSLYLQQIKNF
jgi:hypothetical protein